MAWSDLARRWTGTGLLLAAALLSTTDGALGQAPTPTPPPPAPSPPAPAPPAEVPVEERLRRQEAMIQQLVDQNRKLSEQLGNVTERLDALSKDKTAVPVPPPRDIDDILSPKPEPTDKPPAPTPPTPSPPEPSPPEPSSTPPKLEQAEARPAPGPKSLVDSLHHDDKYGFKTLFDSLHPEGSKGKPWYEKLSIRGYSQIRFGRGIDQDPESTDPFLLGDRSINGNAENFSIRRARLILSGDVSDHLFLYFQPDFATPPPGSTTATYFTQVRDLYGDVYLDKTKIHRLRVGMSKVPYGFENMQSSSNRVPLDRSNGINSGVIPNERDIGVFYYWTPEKKQKLLQQLVDGGLKGSGNYGIFGLGVYNGQGGSIIEKNLNLHTVARFTWPFQLDNGQVVEASIQGYTGDYVVLGTPIRPLGRGGAQTPAGTNGSSGLRDQRLAGTFVWYPQPFGFQAEWNFGEGPGLNDAQTAVDVRPLQGGYLMPMYKIDTPRHGIFIPYARYQFYRGGYRSVSNAPFGNHLEWNLGVEWQIRKEIELVTEYSLIDGPNLNAINEPGAFSYRNFDGSVLRFQCQINY